MSKQTAVKWLEKAFYKSAWSAYAESTGVNNKWLIDEECLAELFNQAKAMEREQIIDACNLQRNDYRGMPTYNKSGEAYYNETYKGGEQ
jgi:hypothetical protein